MMNKIVFLAIIFLCFFFLSCDKGNVEPSGSQLRAENDVKEHVRNDKLRYYVIGQPMAHDLHYKALLKTKCNVDVHLLGFTPIHSEREYAEIYNSLVVPIIDNK